MRLAAQRLGGVMEANRLVIQGREVWVRQVRMEDVYAGILEGEPNAKWNARIVDTIRARAADLLKAPAVVLLPDVERPEPRPGSSYQPEWMPRVACTAELHSASPARDATNDFSDLVVVWFQAEMKFPPDEAMLRKLEAIDWRVHAVDGES
jgi:hypothetical protein